ncbi:MAG: lytic transglycosylase domain-containing protein [Bacteroidia bacterium]
MIKILTVVFALALLVTTSFIGSKQNDASNTEKTDVETPQTAIAPQNVTAPPLPKKLTFAGEPVPLHDDEVRERLEREILSNTFYHSKTLLILKRANRWKAPVQKILKEQGVPADFFYLAIAESALSNTAVSSASAKGMWQFMASVAKEYGLEINTYVDERRHPEKATKAACDYLNEMKTNFGNWTNSAAAYNRGKTGMRNALREQKVESYYDLYLNPETYRYVFRILSYKVIMENPEAYGISLDNSELYTPFNYTTITVDTTINDLPEFAKKYNTTYKELKRLNPWLDINARYMLYVSAGKSYEIKVPKGN